MAEILGGTERFMAPEILQAMEAHNALIPVSVALKADLYSFGLTVCTIALSGRDFFDSLKEAVLDPNDIQVPDSEDLSVFCKTVPVMGAVMCKFARDITAEMRSYGEVEVDIGPAIVKILQQDHEMRPSSAASVLEALGIPDTEPETNFVSNSTAKPTDQNESMPQLDLQPNLASLERGPTRFLGGNDQLFFMNEKLYSVGISESKVNTSMLRLPYSRRWQTFNNLVSNFELIDTDLRSMSAPDVTLKSVQKHARCAFLAYQIFNCYSLGCGTVPDLDKARDYLRRSAELGYVQAIALMHMMKFRDPQSHETSMPEGIPSAVYAMASYGPRFGDHAWPLEMGILRETSPQNYSRVLHQIALYGIPEFSEIIDDDVDPDVENTLNYQYAKLGSMSLAMRMIPLLSVAEFKICLTEKIFPCGQTNRHHETLLYMCCRNADADKAMMLLDTFEWARDQVSTANANGRTPLHWLWLMSPEDVRRVGDALIVHGANTDSGDRFEQRPIDIALKAQRRDVVDYFLEHMTDPFHIVDNLQLNVRIMWNLMAYDDIGLFESYLLQKAEADLITDTSFFQNVFVDNLDSRMAQLGSRRQSRLEFTFRTLKRRFGREAAYQAVLEQLCPPLVLTGDHDVIDAILETRALDHVLPGNSGKAILFWASRLSAFEIFLKFLGIYQDWEIADAHEVLGLAIQNPGPRQRDIIVSLVDHLDKLDLARAAVNYRVPDSCQSGCTTDHSHYFYGSQYWNAIDEGAYEIADYLEPYCDQTDGLPSTIYHILNKPGKDVVNHLEYILRAPDRHRAYVCQPLIQANVLHVAIGSADAYTNLSQLQTVLEMLLEFYIEYLGENIDSTDSAGYTALAYAACTRLSDVVQLLLRWKADPTQTLGNPSSSQVTTAFDHAARQFIVDVENMPAGTGRVTFFHESTSHPLREAEAEHRHHPERMISVLGLLSRPWGRFPPSLISDEAFEPAAEIRGLVPLTYTRNLKFLPAAWKGSAQATGLYAWGHLATPHLEYWINLLDRSEVSDDELAGIRADMFKKRQGETKWHFSIGEYFCRLIRVDHSDEGENSEQEEDLAKRGISVMSDGEVIDDRIDGARIVGDRVVFSSRATGERSGTIVSEEGAGVSGQEDDEG